MADPTRQLDSYLDASRWQALARAKEASWLARWREGPLAQLQAMARLREFAHTARGPASPEDRNEDLAHHIRISALIRRADCNR